MKKYVTCNMTYAEVKTAVESGNCTCARVSIEEGSFVLLPLSDAYLNLDKIRFSSVAIEPFNSYVKAACYSVSYDEQYYGWTCSFTVGYMSQESSDGGNEPFV